MRKTFGLALSKLTAQLAPDVIVSAARHGRAARKDDGTGATFEDHFQELCNAACGLQRNPGVLSSLLRVNSTLKESGKCRALRNHQSGSSTAPRATSTCF